MIALNKNAKRLTPATSLREAVRKKCRQEGYQRDVAIAAVARARRMSVDEVTALLDNRLRKPKTVKDAMRSKTGPMLVSAQFDLTRAIVMEEIAAMMADGVATKMEAIVLIAKYFGTNRHHVMSLARESQNTAEHITPEEIAAGIASIQSGEWKEGAKPWTDAERMKRMNKVVSEVDIRQYTITGCGERAAYREA